MRLPLTQQLSLGLDQKSSQESTPYESKKKGLTLNTLQIDSFKHNSLQISPIPNSVTNFTYGNTIKKNLFETITEINKNEDKQKMGANSDKKSFIRNNQSFGDLSHPITVRSQAFMPFQQRSKEGIEGRSQSYNNLIISSSSQNQRLQSAQSTLFSPIEEEQGFKTSHANHQQVESKNNKNRPSSSQYSLKQSMMTSPSLMYIQHESQSPDIKKNRGQISKFQTTTQPDIGLLQRQEYYMGNIGRQYSQNSEQSENQSSEKIMKNKNHQKGLSLQLKTTNSNRTLIQNQTQFKSNHNLDCDKISPVQKVGDSIQNTSGCLSTPNAIQKKSISLRLINGNNIMLNNNQKKSNNNTIVNSTNDNGTNKCSNINLNIVNDSMQPFERKQSSTNDYCTVQEEDREDNTPQSKKVDMSSPTKVPIANKFKFVQELCSFSQRTIPGVGYFSTQVSMKPGGETNINNFETKKLLQESLLQTPCLSTKSVSGQKIALRPYSAINKTKECNNQFFNTLNANNFVKSSLIKKRRLISPNSHQIISSTNLGKSNSLISKTIQKRPSLQGDQNKVETFQHFHSTHNLDNINTFETSQILSPYTTINSAKKQVLLKQQNSVTKSGSNYFIPQLLEINTSRINTESLIGMQAPRGDTYMKSVSTSTSRVFDGQNNIKESSKSPSKLNTKNKIQSKELYSGIEVHQ